MIIGVVKEILKGENRVSVTPEVAKQFILNNHKVIVEKGAGINSFFSDESYLEAGVELVDSPKDVYEAADLILKVKEPQFNKDLNIHEVDLMKKGQYLITFLHPASPNNHQLINMLQEKGIISLTLDGIPRISRAQSMDALSSMSTCAGYKGMVMAIDDIAKFVPPIGSAVGMIRPATVFVLGCGVAGLRAIATAKGMGANVYAADIRPDAVEQAKSLGAKIIELGVPEKVAISKDGKHAKQLPSKWLEVERENIKDIVSKSDIVFLSALVFGKVAPILITEEMVKTMQSGSCIVDISIDQGGNCEVTEPGVKIVKDEVIINGIKNIPGMLATSATRMFSHNIYNLLAYVTEDGEIKLNLKDEITSSILVTKDGKIHHRGTLEAMGLKRVE